MRPSIQERLERAVPRVAKQFDIDPEFILGITRKKPYPKARRIIAKELRSFGYSFPQIGRAMNRDHTSIIYMVKDDFRAKKIQRNKERYCVKT